MSSDINDMLNQRAKTHGNYHDQARTADTLRGVLMCEDNWAHLSAAQRDALLMIVVKISRILNGNPATRDHWEDIAGYATLVVWSLSQAEEG